MDKSGKATILIVDDVVENLDILSNLLAPMYKVQAATSGEKALKVLEKSQPDMILLDIMMPDMDGYEVIERIKANETTKDIPVIFVSAKGDVQDEARGFRLGAADYIIKPFSPPIIQARVETHLTLYKQKETLKKQNEEMRKTVRVLENKLARFCPLDDTNAQIAKGLKNLQEVTHHDYFLEDHKHELAELIEEIDTNVNMILMRDHINKEYLQKMGEKLLRYALILMLYPAFKRLGTGMYDFSKGVLEEDINPADEYVAFILGCLESLIYTLERWHTQIFSGELQDPNIFDNSMLADMDTIRMALENNYSESEESIEFF